MNASLDETEPNWKRFFDSYCIYTHLPRVGNNSQTSDIFLIISCFGLIKGLFGLPLCLSNNLHITFELYTCTYMMHIIISCLNDLAMAEQNLLCEDKFAELLLVTISSSEIMYLSSQNAKMGLETRPCVIMFWKTGVT